MAPKETAFLAYNLKGKKDKEITTAHCNLISAINTDTDPKKNKCFRHKNLLDFRKVTQYAVCDIIPPGRLGQHPLTT